MSNPNDFNKFPEPSPASAGRNNLSIPGSMLAKIARLWRPANAGVDEVPVATIARVAKYITDASGNALAAEDIGAPTSASVLALLAGETLEPGTIEHDGSDANPNRYTAIRSRQYNADTGAEVGPLRLQFYNGDLNDSPETFAAFSGAYITHNYDIGTSVRDIPGIPHGRIGWECLYPQNIDEFHPYGQDYELNFDCFPSNGISAIRFIACRYDSVTGNSYSDLIGQGKMKALTLFGIGDQPSFPDYQYSLAMAGSLKVKGGSLPTNAIRAEVSTDAPQSFTIDVDISQPGPITETVQDVDVIFASDVVVGSPLTTVVSCNVNQKDSSAIAQRIIDYLNQVPAITAHWNFARVASSIIATRNTIAEVDKAASMSWAAAGFLYAATSIIKSDPGVNNSKVELQGSSEAGSPTFGMTLDKNGSGSKDAHIYNESGDVMKIRNADSAVEFAGDIQIKDVGTGVVIPSLDGNRWRMTVSNAGAPVFTALTADSDAQAYATAVGTAKGSGVTTAQLFAIHDFVVAEKASGRWTKHKRLFFPIWNNAAANRIDMKTLGLGTINGAFTYSNGKMLSNSASSYFDFGGSPSGLGLTNATRAAIWYFQADAGGGTNLYPIASYQTSKTSLMLEGISGTNVYAWGEDTRVIAPPVYRGGIMVSSFHAGEHFGKCLQGSSFITDQKAVPSLFVPPTINVYAFMGNFNGSTSGSQMSQGLGGFGLMEGISEGSAEDFMQNLKTLWTTCTGLAFP